MDNIESISVEFPLRGEWMAANAPGTKIPSHGIDDFGMTYVYDLLGVVQSQNKLDYVLGGFAHKRSNLDYFLGKAHLNDFYGWSKPISAPFSGTVVEASDGYSERESINILHELLSVLKNELSFRMKKIGIQELAGNYVILKGEKAHAFFAHMRKGSVKVKQGDKIKTGDILGEVGHSGNSTAPHLHFQLMDRADVLTAKGVPFSFKEYELYNQDEWVKVENGIPKNKDRIRYNGNPE